MKPCIIYIKPNKNNKIILTKEEFEDYIEFAYEAGKADRQHTCNSDCNKSTSPRVSLHS